jgi:hypothetical protein
MRLYNIASGTLLILPVIDFALAAPVQIQRDSRASADVVHTPRDMITVLEKRMDGEGWLEKIATYFGPLDESVGSLDAHVSSSSAPPGPDHGDAQPPNPESSTANPDNGSVEPSSSSSTTSKFDKEEVINNQALATHYDAFPNRPPAPDSGSFDHRITSYWPDWDTHDDVLWKEGPDAPHAPAPNSESSAANPDHGSVEPSSPLSAGPMPVSIADELRAQRFDKFYKDNLNWDNHF